MEKGAKSKPVRRFIFTHTLLGNFFLDLLKSNIMIEICSHDHLREKALKFRFRKPISSKSTLTKKKQRRKIESEVEEKRRIENNNGYTLSFYKGYFGEKSCWTDVKKGPFGKTVKFRN